MKVGTLPKIDLFFFTGSIFLLVAIGFYVLEQVSREPSIEPGTERSGRLERIQQNIQADFTDLVNKVEAQSASIADNYARQGMLPEDPEVVRLVFVSRCRLLEWSNPQLMPPAGVTRDLCKYDHHRTYRNENKIYYLLRHERGDTVLITLIPLQIKYRIRNANLPQYVFLGRYNHDPAVQAEINNFEVVQRAIGGSVVLFDQVKDVQNANFVASIVIPDPEVFSYATRHIIVVMGFIGLILLLTWLYRRILKGLHFRLPGNRSFSLSKEGGLILFVVLILLLRYFLLQQNFPTKYVPSKLFSVTLLALEKLTPSLGDLFLNMITLLISVLALTQAAHRSLGRFYERVLRRPWLAYLVQVVLMVVAVQLIFFFFAYIHDILEHSKIFFEYSEIFSLNVFSFLAFLIIGGFLVALMLLLLQLFRFNRLFEAMPGQHRYLKWGGGALVLVGYGLLIFGGQVIPTLACLAVGVLCRLILWRAPADRIFRPDLLNFLLVVVAFSVLATGSISRGLEDRQAEEMKRLAYRQVDDHDLITEFLFKRVVKQIEEDAFMLEYSLSARSLAEKYFEPNFKGFEVRIYVYSQDTVLEDQNTKQESYRPLYKYPRLDSIGISVPTENLYLIPYEGGLHENIYIGRFDLLLREKGAIVVQVELIPTDFLPNQLYPQLLLDDKVLSKSNNKAEYDYAVYVAGRLNRKKPQSDFPEVYTGPVSLPEETGFLYETSGGYANMYHESENGKVVHIRTKAKGFWEHANLFSFIFYFFILAAILFMIPIWLYRITNDPVSVFQLSLKNRIQVFFLVITLLPMIVVLLLLSPYIKNHIYENTTRDLQLQTARVAEMVRQEYVDLLTNDLARSNMTRLLRDKLGEMEKTIFNDINIFRSGGLLHLTTQNNIYDQGLISNFMNPAVLREFRSGKSSEIVIEDHIGEVNFFSGFYPLRDNERKVRGYLNIPFLKNPDEANQQSLSLLTFLVNIYVFVFLAIGLIAVLISNSITRPLTLLRNKLAATNLGQTNEPIEWNSQDEIGEIIRSYNEMLEKLADSEQKLAQQNREMAWKEMARQVAHEIKNPLTPMKLSIQHLQRSWGGDQSRLEKLFKKVMSTLLVQIDSLTAIANSFSEFAKMPEPKKTTFELQAVLEEVTTLYGQDSEVQLKVDIPGPEFYVHSDRDQLSRVFNNLIKNAQQAINHDAGEINVVLELTASLATIRVVDNGSGIPDEIKEKIFQPKFSTKTSGMGLGLAIVKRIIENSGGKIYFESTLGKGTTFYVELPKAAELP